MVLQGYTFAGLSVVAVHGNGVLVYGTYMGRIAELILEKGRF